ncbi:MAG TPA: YfhO family protein, partial [Thermoanaerobaculia bacterium]|nr:YfhO family protein [Thermoanaerobaculia bacterium]
AAALAGVLGVALAAPQLLPFAAAAGHSLRAGERLAGGLPQVEAGRGARGWFVEEGWQIFPGPFSPLVYGKPYGPTFGGPWAWPIALSAYTGLVALAAAAAAALGRKRRRIATPFLLTWVVALVLASRFVPLEQLLFRVPPLRVPELSRMLPFGCLGLAVAAALGIEQLRQARRRALPAAVACVALVPALLLTPRWEVAVLVATAAAGVWLLALRRVSAGVAVLAAALLLDLVPWGRPQLPAADAASFYPLTGTIRAVKREMRHGPWRAVAEDLLVYPSLLPVYGVADVRPHNPLAVREQLAVLGRAFGFAPGGAFESYFSRFGNVEHPLLDFLNVRVVLTNPYLPAKRRLERVYGPDPRVFEVWRNPDALPRWFLPTAAEAVPKRRVLDWIGGLADARRVALLAEEAQGWLPAPRAWQADAVQALREVPGDLELQVGGAGERLLATSLPGPRGWSARGGSDRGELPVLTVNGAFLGVRIPPGVERVQLRYVPPGLWPGVAIAVVGALGLLVATTSAPAWSRGSGRSRAGSRR